MWAVSSRQLNSTHLLFIPEIKANIIWHYRKALLVIFVLKWNSGRLKLRWEKPHHWFLIAWVKTLRCTGDGWSYMQRGRSHLFHVLSPCVTGAQGLLCGGSVGWAHPTVVRWSWVHGSVGNAERWPTAGLPFDRLLIKELSVHQISYQVGRFQRAPCDAANSVSLQPYLKISRGNGATCPLHSGAVPSLLWTM